MTVFTRLYLVIVLVLVLSAVGLLLLVDQVNRYRFADYVAAHQSSLQAIIDYNSVAFSSERQADWINIISRLTGADWQLVTTPQLAHADVDWWSQSARLTLTLNDNNTLQAHLTDWNELTVGMGFLMTNALSLQAAEARSSTLENLSRDSKLIVQPVRWEEENLGFLQQRQLSQGQAVLIPAQSTATTNTLYIPMGQGNALRIATYAGFQWFTPTALLLLTALALAIVAVSIFAILAPFKRRLAQMIKAIDAIRHGQPIRINESPSDELGKLGAHINRMADELVQAATRNRTLNQALSHDLKTPVAQIMFALELLHPTPEQQATVATMHRSVRGMSQLIDELLAYHRLTAAPDTITQENVELADLLTALKEDILDTYPERTLTVLLNTAPLSVSTDATLLRRLLQNLLDNAFKFCHQNVQISAEPDANGISIMIDDDGPGIPAAEREKVLQPFYQVDNTRESTPRGHGLGLAICHEICQTLGATFAIGDSTLGGCRILIHLPLLHYKT